MWKPNTNRTVGLGYSFIDIFKNKILIIFNGLMAIQYKKQNKTQKQVPGFGDLLVLDSKRT